MYKRINLFLQRFFKPSTIFKTLFNIAPMYRRTGGKIVEASEDMSKVVVRIKYSWRNVNYMGTMFGGSMFSATDPIYMIQYNEMLGHEYVVWDKSASIQFKRPAKENIYVDFIVTEENIKEAKQKAEEFGSYTFMQSTDLTNKDKTVVFATIEKEIYVATKEHYRKRRAEKQKENSITP